jgi:hypothetical protein
MYTAVIVEPRFHPSLPIVLNNFNSNLDNNWNFLIFHGSDNKKYIENIFNTIQTTKKCTYINLNKNNLTIKEYNKLLYSYFFYLHIETEHFLVFQTDTLLSNTNSKNIYKFLEYDYVGAPWRHRNKQIGNGGLSLRKKSKMLELLNSNFSFKVLNINEDLFFSGSRLNENNIKIHKPTPELAKQFSVESVFSTNSVGLHKPWIYFNNKQLNTLQTTFPELNNLITTIKTYKLNKNKIKINKNKINKNKINKNKLNTNKLNTNKFKLNIMKTNISKIKLNIMKN